MVLLPIFLFYIFLIPFFAVYRQGNRMSSIFSLKEVKETDWRVIFEALKNIINSDILERFPKSSIVKTRINLINSKSF